ncbi:hypothetical protein KFL_010780020 [Klebsormidium nitens]|uniref:Uncharacterized protein n=1 Tax=Klebsormidium nitens TaxID=105231 RepID=A0A1Y1IRG4_KLENI|nr:hypothetical protein KFL_010780020 [Klebsormidium nitens]|eukprot:GAQ92632.1 hypothetical protein KFL_010780020 [Klebsormidium nitens]
MDPLGSSTFVVLFLRAVLLDLFPNAEKIEEFLNAAGIEDCGGGRKPMVVHYLYSMVDDLLRDTSAGGLDDVVADANENIRAADVIFKDGDTLSLESLVAGLYHGLNQYMADNKSLTDKISWPRTFGVPRCQKLGRRGLLAAIDYFLARAKEDPALCRALLAYLDNWFSDPSSRHCVIAVRARARACLNYLLGAADDTTQDADVSSQIGAVLLGAADVATQDVDFFTQNGALLPADAGDDIFQQVDKPWSPFDVARDLVRNGDAPLVLDCLGPVAMEMAEGEDAVDAAHDLEMQAAFL